jgi:hypothetical protein
MREGESEELPPSAAVDLVDDVRIGGEDGSDALFLLTSSSPSKRAFLVVVGIARVASCLHLRKDGGDSRLELLLPLSGRLLTGNGRGRRNGCARSEGEQGRGRERGKRKRSDSCERNEGCKR